MESNHPAVPRARHSFDVRMEDGAIIRVRQHGVAAAPRLVLSHGNGLAIDGYLPFWGPLCARYEVVLFDFRNHGHNPLHREEAHLWTHFVTDMETVFAAIGRELGVKRTAGVFHSLSGVTAAMHARRFGKRFDALVLFDSPVFPPQGHRLRRNQADDKTSLAGRARRRTERYADPSVLAAQFRKYNPLWRPEAYELMARATLRHDTRAGDWILACPRELEANVFSTNADPTLWNAMGSIPVPVKLICGDPNLVGAMPPALIGRELAAEHKLPYEAIAGTTHFLQIEQPEQCTRAMESFLAKYDLAAR
ncbi:MAG TPA: alpha/beta hydrolase [Candidatus Binataceae bacterium]|nr:alpha/beta hydrolase [Candidatus Binataceae bacterium]